MEWADGQLSITLNLGNFLQLTDDPLYFDAYLQSLQVAAISTFCCLLIGYPLAWAVAPVATGGCDFDILLFTDRLSAGVGGGAQ